MIILNGKVLTKPKKTRNTKGCNSAGSRARGDIIKLLVEHPSLTFAEIQAKLPMNPHSLEYHLRKGRELGHIIIASGKLKCGKDNAPKYSASPAQVEYYKK